MPHPSETTKTQVTHSEWFRSLAKYEKPDHRKAIWQLLNTFVPYVALWALMVWMIRQGISLWFLIPPVVLAAGLLVRIFIFFHDCGHGSFFASRWANRFVGHLCGVLTFTPFEDWRYSHARHHAAAEDLDRRGIGDIWTWTVEEYRNAPLLKRLAYRGFRHPLIFLVIGPPILFLITQRFPHKGAPNTERHSVAFTNLAIMALVGLASMTIGLKTYLTITIPVVSLAGAFGVWMFYVQHQFEGVYWARHDAWDPIRAALEGSSYYKLPAVFQWFSGNIGLHHIHHLRSRIPNYNLQQCYDETPELHIEPLTFVRSLHSLRLNLWDEAAQQMVSFRSLKTKARPQKPAHGAL